MVGQRLMGIGISLTKERFVYLVVRGSRLTGRERIMTSDEGRGSVKESEEKGRYADMGVRVDVVNENECR